MTPDTLPGIAEQNPAAIAKRKAEQYADRILYRLGILPGFRGHKYLLYAITICILDPSNLELLTKTLYPSIAHQYATTVPCVERSMRYVLSQSLVVHPDTITRWNEAFASFLVYKKDTKPTIGAFITMSTMLYNKDPEI